MKKLLLSCALIATATAAIAVTTPSDFRTILLNVSPPGAPVQVAVGDVDADGRNELVVVTPSSPVSQSELRVFEIAADGTATLERTLALPAPPAEGFSYAQPRIVDVDADGDRDIALYLRADGQCGVLQLAQWNGGGFSVSTFAMPETDAAYGFAMADIDGDGIADAITANHGRTAQQTLFVSHGASQFATFDEYPVPFNGANVFGPNQRGLIYVYARDLDVDGRVDILASTAPFNNIAARILFNKPTGMVVRNVAGAPSTDIAVFDSTADGILDLVMNGNGTTGIRTFRGGAFTSVSSLNTPTDPRTPVLGDINKDGVRDIIVAPTLSKLLTVLIGGSTGSMSIVTPEVSAADFMPGSYVQELTGGDLDNDGDFDVVFATDRVIWLRYGASDTTPPVITVPANILVEATSPSGAVVSWTASAVDETNGNVAVQCSPSSGSLFAIGTATVSCSAQDAAGNSATLTFTVTVRDTTAPVIQSASASPSLLSPPNHKMVPVTISVSATDQGDAAPVSRIVSVTSNESPNGLGDGNTSGDWIITGPLSVSLRSERSGKGNGRIYTISVETRDRFGNTASATTQVLVK